MPGEPLIDKAGSSVIGYFGKVPKHGDFVQKRLPRAFLDPWDDWLQRAIAASKAALGESWLNIYLTSPIWRFALCPGLCSRSSVAGVVMPSVDSVGRYYPITLAILTSAEEHPFHLATSKSSWFQEAEDVALSCLEESFQLETLDEKLKASLGSADENRKEHTSVASTFVNASASLSWVVGDDTVDQLSPGVYADLLDQFTREKFQLYSLWWTSGSDQLPPSFRICDRLPPVDGYATFLSNRIDAAI